MNKLVPVGGGMPAIFCFTILTENCTYKIKRHILVVLFASPSLGLEFSALKLNRGGSFGGIGQTNPNLGVEGSVWRFQFSDLKLN